MFRQQWALRAVWLLPLLSAASAHGQVKQPSPKLHHTRLMVQMGNVEGIACVALSPDSRYVLIGGFTTGVYLWNAATGEALVRYPVTGILDGLAFTPDAKYVIAQAKDQLEGDSPATLWSTATGAMVRQNADNDPRVRLANSNGSSCGDEQTTRSGRFTLSRSGKQFTLSDSTTHAMRQFEIPDAYSPYVLSHDGRRILTATADNTAGLWDITSDKPRLLTTFRGTANPIPWAGFVQGDPYLLARTSHHKLTLLNALSGKGSRHEANSVCPMAFRGTVSANGLFAADGCGHIWDIAQEKRSIDVKWPTRRQNTVSIALSHDGQLFAAADREGDVLLWRTSTGELLRTLPRILSRGAPPFVDALAFSSDGRRIAISGMDGHSSVRDVEGDATLPLVARRNDVDGYTSTQLSSIPASVNDEARRQGRKEIRSSLGSEVVTAIAFSPDGKLIATGDDRGFVCVFDAATGTQLPIHFEGHDNQVQSVAFSPDSHSLVTASRDNITRIWSLTGAHPTQQFPAPGAYDTQAVFSPDALHILTVKEDGRAQLWSTRSGLPEATIISLGNEEWAVTNPAGHYDAANPDTSSLFWVTDNLRTIALSQLERVYYQPRLLSRILDGGDPLPSVADMDTVALPPILNPASAYDATRHRLKVILKDDGGGIGTLRVKVNGRVVLETKKHPPPIGSDITWPLDLTDAPLVPGANTIVVSAYEASDRIESRELIVPVNLPAPPIARGSAGGVTIHRTDATTAAGSFYAILVGTGDFAGGEKMRLQYPAKDARSMAQALRIGADALYGDAGKVHITLLTSATTDRLPGEVAATRANIQQAFDDVTRQATPQDTLVVFMAGHGAMSRKDTETYYYLTQDAATLDTTLLDAEYFDDPQHPHNSLVSGKELFGWLGEKSMPLKEVVILDTCAAGGAGAALTSFGARGDAAPGQIRALELLKDATGTFILMGTAAGQFSYEAPLFQDGLLTYALLQGMSGLSVEDSQLNVSKWLTDAIATVPALAAQVGTQQQPLLAVPLGRGFPIGLLTHENEVRIPLAQVKQQLLRVDCAGPDDLDPLGLRRLVRDQLLTLNRTPPKDTQVFYIDTTDDDIPGAILPKLQYTIKGKTVSVRIRLILDDRQVAEEQFPKTGAASTSDPTALAKQLAEQIVVMTEAVRAKRKADAHSRPPS